VIARTLLALGVLCSAASVGAQSGDDYLRLLRVYQDQPALAAQTAAKLSPQAVDRGIQLCRAGHCSLQQIRAAAMLHADAAELVIGPDGRAARDQIRSGRELLQIATNLAAINHATHADLTALASFGGRWYALTARLLMAHGHLTVANDLMVEGRVRYPESPDLFVVRGLLSEWRAGLGLEGGDLRSHIVRGELPERAGLAAPYRGNVSFDLATASGEYRRAIAIDPGHAGARLRLAWAHLLTSDRRVWEDVSPAFIQGASMEAQYLAHLLRGTAAEHQKNAPSALAEYQAARSIAPDSQTACLGVSSAHALNGDLAEARAVAAECFNAGAGAQGVDPWTLFRLGLMDAATVEGLRQEARRR
jgi:tetratricopeptide (TPR) repeat protein